jgi:hypothetical protein
MIITNGYGRSSTASNLYRLSATGQFYTFQTYASEFSKCIQYIFLNKFLFLSSYLKYIIKQWKYTRRDHFDHQWTIF